MVIVLHSATKVAWCSRFLLQACCNTSERVFSTSLHYINFNLVQNLQPKQKGGYRWTIKQNNGATDKKIDEVNQICWDLDLYKIYYEKIFYLKSFKMREISLIRLYRKMSFVVRHFAADDLVSRQSWQVEQLFLDQQFKGLKSNFDKK